jgi:hypothetical protein
MNTAKLFAAVCAAALWGAYENKSGWKTDADGKLVADANGNPIYIDANGQEMVTEAGTIARLNAEAKTHREAKEAAENKLKAFNGLDPDKAREAIETVGKIDQKKLIDAGEVDKVRETIKAEYSAQLNEAQKTIGERDARINDMTIQGVFSNSEFIRDQVAMPRDFFEAAMRPNFKVEDGKPVAYDRAGNRLMSKKRVGEYADPDEALQLLVEMHPQKDTILKAPDAQGTGNGGGGGNRSGGRTMKRADFEALGPQQQAAIATKGEVAIVD